MTAGTGVPPSGVVTFLFTDIEASTWTLQHLAEEYDQVLHDHNRLLRDAWAAHDGFEVSTAGDAFFVTFDEPGKALRAALDAQRALDAHRWPEGGRIRVRMGIHTGEARVYGNDYVGMAVNQAARIASAAHGGQVLVSETTKTTVDAISFTDLGLHRLKDMAHPVHLFQLDHPELDSEFPPPRTLSVMPNNFPLQLTSFVGRDDDIAEVLRTLGTSRLVTLVGSGGVGKTRLALQVGAELMDGFADGAWLADLAPLADEVAVVGAVAGAVGVREQPGRDLSETLADALLSKELLIVLDNCEHVMDASAGVVHRILSSCPRVKVLATSREALNVGGEVTYRLRSLSVPDVRAGDDLGPVAQTESVRLFVQRARDARPEFDLNSENADAITQICRRLDGLPLAIELAAARIRSMSVQDIAGRLDDRFRLLTGGARLALPRQRTLEATVSWSYDLLSNAEQVVFDHLSVFAGGCTVDAAERVCTDTSIDPVEVFDILARLVDRSLVVVEESAECGTRYRLLETLRQFGRDRLLARGQTKDARDRHLAWVVALAQTLPPQTGAGLPPEVDAESDNLHAAIEWAIETDDHTSALQILADVWNIAVHFETRARWYETLLPSAERISSDVAARVLAGAGGLAFMMGDWELSAARSMASARASRAVGNQRMLALGLLYGGASRWGLGDDDAAIDLLDEGLAVAQEANDDEMIRRALVFQAWAKADRDVDGALEVAIEADRLSSEQGTPFDRSHAREVLGYIHALKGDLPGARSILAEAVPLFADVLLSCTSHVLETSAAWAAMDGRLELAAELWGAADRLRDETRDRPRPWERTVHEVWLPKIREQLDPVAFEAARARGALLDRDDAIVYARDSLSE